MKLHWVFGLAGLLVGVILAIGIQRGISHSKETVVIPVVPDFPLKAKNAMLIANGEPNPNCQPCKQRTFDHLRQCEINACTSVSGQDLGAGCKNPADINRYRGLIQQCLGEYNSLLAACPCP